MMTTFRRPIPAGIQTQRRAFFVQRLAPSFLPLQKRPFTKKAWAGRDGPPKGCHHAFLAPTRCSLAIATPPFRATGLVSSGLSSEGPSQTAEHDTGSLMSQASRLNDPPSDQWETEGGPLAGAGHVVVVKAKGAVIDSVDPGTFLCPDSATRNPKITFEVPPPAPTTGPTFGGAGTLFDGSQPCARRLELHVSPCFPRSPEMQLGDRDSSVPTGLVSSGLSSEGR